MKKQLLITFLFLALVQLSHRSQAQLVDIFATPTDVISDAGNSAFTGPSHTGAVRVTVGNFEDNPVPAGQMSVVITLNQYINFAPDLTGSLIIPNFEVVSEFTTSTSVYLRNTVPITEALSPFVLQIGVRAIQQVGGTTITSTASLIEPTDLFEEVTSNNTSSRAASVGAIALPVTLASFTAKAVNKHAVLEWVTSMEKNNAYFEVQHSTNARDFAVLGKIEGHGTTFETHKYQFMQEFPDPSVIHYYRLRQVDTDGKFEYSMIRSLTFDGYVGIELKLAVNPVTNGTIKAYIDYGDENLSNQANMVLTDIMGRTVGKQSVELQKGRNSVHFQGLSLRSGLYMLSLQNTSLLQPKFVKVAVQ
ncbi:hypothetical protein GCM10027299_53730 [Larkinella ripae]